MEYFKIYESDESQNKKAFILGLFFSFIGIFIIDFMVGGYMFGRVQKRLDKYCILGCVFQFSIALFFRFIYISFLS
jgi:hypothetical protein